MKISLYYLILISYSSFLIAAPTSSSPPNVILITLSSLRADHVGHLGYDRNTTPHLDAFARHNTSFTSAFATSGWMMPAHASILTGLYPKDHRVTHVSHTLADSFTTFPEVLSNRGYICAGFCCNPRLSSKAGFDQGFDLYDDYSVTLHLENMFLDAPNDLDINTHRTNELINDAAIGWLKRNTHHPFFLFVHYYDNHWDYLPPSPHNQRFDPNYTGEITGHQIAREPLFSNPPVDADIEHLIALYDGEVYQTDQDLGELLEALEQMDLISNSLIIITADHGEQFYEHGYTSHHGIFEELIHIPLVISVPHQKNSPKTIDALTSQVDIAPTILNYLNLPPLNQGTGISLKPLIDSKKNTHRNVIYAQYSGGAAARATAIRSSSHKVYHLPDQSSYGYDLTKDPAEQNKIAPDAFTEPLLKLHQKLQKWLKP